MKGVGGFVPLMCSFFSWFVRLDGGRLKPVFQTASICLGFQSKADFTAQGKGFQPHQPPYSRWLSGCVFAV